MKTFLSHRFAFVVAAAFCLLPSRSGAAGAERLYVGNQNNVIAEFDGDGTSNEFTSAGVNNPNSLAFDAAGNLYVANFGSDTVAKIAPDGTSSVFATFPGKNPAVVAVDAAGNVYVMSYDDPVIQRFTPGGAGSLFADTGLHGASAMVFNTGASYSWRTLGPTPSK